MRIHNIKVNTRTKKYSIIIGSQILKNILKILSKENIYFEKCLIVTDKNIPYKFRSILLKKLKKKKNIYI